jgi:FAD/FMN-containing dehydrogenase
VTVGPGPTATGPYHVTTIAAAPEVVWETLVDVASWSDWNPTLRTSARQLAPGRTVWMWLTLGRLSVPLHQHIRRMEAGRLLTWRTTNGLPGLLDVDRVFQLTANGSGTTLVQSETTSGLLAPVLAPRLTPAVEAGFAALGTALQRRVERAGETPRALAPPGPPTAESSDRADRRRRTSTMARPRIGQADWRRSINQHETFDHDSIDSLFYDWDRIGDPDGSPRSPLKFYVPRTTDDVVRCVEECARLGQPLFVRSKGHSSNDLVTPPGGAVLLTEKLTGVLDVDEEDLTVTVYAGTPSAEVDEYLAQRGLGLPVIGDHAHITVGGFFSVGGITASSFRFGLFVDVVRRAEYVDWSGQVHTVDRDEGAEQFHRLATGLGRHGVVTTLTLDVLRIEKYATYWHNDATRYRDLDGFIRASHELCADPPADARFLRGLWVDFPKGSGSSLALGTFSVYREADPSTAQRALERVSHGGLHRLGWMGGRLPTKLDEAVKKVGMAGVVFAPPYATVKNAEFFTEKILDATVGDPQRFLVVISPIAIYEEQFRRLWQLLVDYRERYGCFTFLTLYVKAIRSPYLAQGDPDNERWVEFLFYVGIDPDLMTPSLLDQLADELDQNCIDTGSYRYMHTRTGRDPDRLARIDPNAPYNDGRSVHPLDRRPELAGE